MEIQQDFRDLLQLFNETNVEYIVVGGYALAFHGVPRYTGDIDLWLKISKQNAENVIKALRKFGFGSIKLSPSDLTQKDQIIQIGYPPVRIDLMTSIDGVDWDDAFKNSLKSHYGDITINLISKEDFIKNKKATGRFKDLADIESLNESLD